MQDEVIYVNIDDCLFIRDTIYFKLTTILKALNITSFTYDNTKGEDDDFITYRGVDYISPNMVRKLSKKKEQKITVHKGAYSMYITPWAGRD